MAVHPGNRRQHSKGSAGRHGQRPSAGTCSMTPSTPTSHHSVRLHRGAADPRHRIAAVCGLRRQIGDVHRFCVPAQSAARSDPTQARIRQTEPCGRITKWARGWRWAGFCPTPAVSVHSATAMLGVAATATSGRGRRPENSPTWSTAHRATTVAHVHRWVRGVSTSTFWCRCEMVSGAGTARSRRCPENATPRNPIRIKVSELAGPTPRCDRTPSPD